MAAFITSVAGKLSLHISSFIQNQAIAVFVFWHTGQGTVKRVLRARFPSGPGGAGLVENLPAKTFANVPAKSWAKFWLTSGAVEVKWLLQPLLSLARVRESTGGSES